MVNQKVCKKKYLSWGGGGGGGGGGSGGRGYGVDRKKSITRDHCPAHLGKPRGADQ